MQIISDLLKSSGAGRFLLVRVSETQSCGVVLNCLSRRKRTKLNPPRVLQAAQRLLYHTDVCLQERGVRCAAIGFKTHRCLSLINQVGLRIMSLLYIFLPRTFIHSLQLPERLTALNRRSGCDIIIVERVGTVADTSSRYRATLAFMVLCFWCRHEFKSNVQRCGSVFTCHQTCLLFCYMSTVSRGLCLPFVAGQAV